MNWKRIALGGIVSAICTFVFAGVAGFLITARIYTAMLQRLHLTMPFSTGAVIWDIAASLISGFVVFAGLLHLPVQEERDQLKIVQAVKHWLTSNTGWLLLLDNADDLALVLGNGR